MFRLVDHCRLCSAGVPRSWNRMFCEIRSLFVRQLPPDPPWSAQVLVDAVPVSANGSGEPVRIFGTTVVNYGALPKGASTSRLENLRNLAAYLAAQNSALEIDPDTTQFLQGRKLQRGLRRWSISTSTIQASAAVDGLLTRCLYWLPGAVVL